MSNWPTLPLSEVVALQRGHDLPTASRHHGDVPVVGSFGITGWHDEAKSRAPGVTIGRSGASIGTAVFVDVDFWPLNTCLYVTDFKGNDPRWVFHVLDLIDFAAYNSGSAQPSLNRNYLALIPVAVPPLDEQKRIARVLRALDDLIATDRHQVERLEELARAIAAAASDTVELRELAQSLPSKQVKPSGPVEHYSLPAFDAGAVPELIDGQQIQSNKLRLTQTCVLISRLNPKWERCWMTYPKANAVASTEFVPVVGTEATTEEVWAVTSTADFWEQMRSHVTGTTGSHQRVDKTAVHGLMVSDVRTLPVQRRSSTKVAVEGAQAMRTEIAELIRVRDELLPLLMSGAVRISEDLAVA
nr:restriction endonuclease subunit S [Mycobacterium riyadhense]